MVCEKRGAHSDHGEIGREFGRLVVVLGGVVSRCSLLGS